MQAAAPLCLLVLLKWGKEFNVSKKEEKFRDIWVNQGALGKALNLSAVVIGKKLKELELWSKGETA